VEGDIVAMAGVNQSKGPVLEPGVDKGVHIIFHPPDGKVDPDSYVPPTQAERDAVAKAHPDATPTDVIVYKGKPWHRVNDTLEKHPEVHVKYPQTILTLVVERQKGVWWSEQHFDITSIGPHDAAVAAPVPFPTPPTRLESDVDSLAPQIHVARSAAPVPEAKQHEYKITFRGNGRTIDPNMKCI
jgi:hypothetical protein